MEKIARGYVEDHQGDQNSYDSYQEEPEVRGGGRGTRNRTLPLLTKLFPVKIPDKRKLTWPERVRFRVLVENKVKPAPWK